jgi:hypothetical protein
MTPQGFVSSLALASLLLAPSAFAQTYDANASFECSEETTQNNGVEKIMTVKGGNRDIIALCNGLDPTDPDNESAIKNLEEEQALVINGARQLLVIDRCSGTTFCRTSLVSGEDVCAEAEKEDSNGLSTKSDCIRYPGDFLNLDEDEDILEFDGALRCTESSKEPNNNDPSFKMDCDGTMAIVVEIFEGEFPCSLQVSTGNQFKEPSENECSK